MQEHEASIQQNHESKRHMSSRTRTAGTTVATGEYAAQGGKTFLRHLAGKYLASEPHCSIWQSIYSDATRSYSAAVVQESVERLAVERANELLQLVHRQICQLLRTSRNQLRIFRERHAKT